MLEGLNFVSQADRINNPMPHFSPSKSLAISDKKFPKISHFINSHLFSRVIIANKYRGFRASASISNPAVAGSSHAGRATRAVAKEGARY
jgi:hypothetical protein